jgi:hypothetical protein
VVHVGNRSLPYNRFRENLFRLKIMEPRRTGIEQCKTYFSLEALIVQVPDPSLPGFAGSMPKIANSRQLPCPHAERLVVLDIRAKLVVKKAFPAFGKSFLCGWREFADCPMLQKESRAATANSFQL